MPSRPDVRIMIVEDDVLLALDLADTLRDAGLTILGPFGAVDVALGAVNADRPEVAILDIDLNGVLSFPIADALAAANVPFLWLSASSPDVVPATHQTRPFLSKPFAAPTLLRVVRDLVKTA
jgi:DNA-binding response OmpR family regulator